MRETNNTEENSDKEMQILKNCVLGGPNPFEKHPKRRFVMVLFQKRQKTAFKRQKKTLSFSPFHVGRKNDPIVQKKCLKLAKK